jgi:serine/threonine protein kinase
MGSFKTVYPALRMPMCMPVALALSAPESGQSVFAEGLRQKSHDSESSIARVVDVDLISDGTEIPITIVVQELWHASFWDVTFKRGKLQPHELRRLEPQIFAENEKVLRSVLQALKYLHSQKLVHADLKEDNILVRFGAVGWIKAAALTDFGCCGEIGSLAYDTGTQGYIPLSALKDSNPTREVAWDLFALGNVIQTAYSQTIHPQKIESERCLSKPSPNDRRVVAVSARPYERGSLSQLAHNLLNYPGEAPLDTASKVDDHFRSAYNDARKFARTGKDISQAMRLMRIDTRPLYQ